jgi:hypothetical protein
MRNKSPLTTLKMERRLTGKLVMKSLSLQLTLKEATQKREPSLKSEMLKDLTQSSSSKKLSNTSISQMLKPMVVKALK